MAWNAAIHRVQGSIMQQVFLRVVHHFFPQTRFFHAYIVGIRIMGRQRSSRVVQQMCDVFLFLFLFSIPTSLWLCHVRTPPVERETPNPGAL